MIQSQTLAIPLHMRSSMTAGYSPPSPPLSEGQLSTQLKRGQLPAAGLILRADITISVTYVQGYPDKIENTQLNFTQTIKMVSIKYVLNIA